MVYPDRAGVGCRSGDRVGGAGALRRWGKTQEERMEERRPPLDDRELLKLLEAGHRQEEARRIFE